MPSGPDAIQRQSDRRRALGGRLTRQILPLLAPGRSTTPSRALGVPALHTQDPSIDFMRSASSSSVRSSIWVATVHTCPKGS